MSKRKHDFNCILPITLSQNFLTSRKIIERLVKRTSINESDHVVEIGAGKGHITRVLMEYCRSVSAVELDKKLYDKLVEKCGECEKLMLYNSDFMKWKLPNNGAYKVFANIPFNRTTDIVRKLTEHKNPPKEAWLIMEKDAAKRFVGAPKENLRSLLLKPLFELSIIYYFKREDFHPMPRVDVVMLHIRKKAARDVPYTQWQSYQRFTETGFANRKEGLLCLFTKKQLAIACKAAGVNDITAGDILYIQWLCLFRSYCGLKRQHR